MKLSLYLAVTCALVILFQNCSKTGVDTVAVETTGINSPQPKGVSNSSQISESGPIQNVHHFDVYDSKGSNAIGKEVGYQIGLLTGKILKIVNNEVKEDEVYCLSDEMLSELNATLLSSEICSQENKSEFEDKVCTMAYLPPYAQIVFNTGKALKLGESVSGCSHGPDICGVRREMLKGFIAHFLSKIEDFRCPAAGNN